MILKTARLTIRPPEIHDLESSLNIWTDPIVRKFSSGAASESKVKQGFFADLKLRDSVFGFRTVIENSSGAHIGDCGLIKKEIDSKSEVEIVYFFNRNYWGQGYASEAARAILIFAQKEIQLTRIVALIHPDNAASKRVAEKLGMKFEKKVVTTSGNLRGLYVIDAGK